MNLLKIASTICLISCFLFSCSSDKEQKNQQPNIILICADDLGWSDLGCYGSDISTPNLDKLAENGMRFTRFHNTSKCFPSRASLLTGVYAQDCGYGDSYNDPIRNAVTIGEVLRESGYRTYFAGKHHGKDNPYNRGFDHYYGLKDGACNYFNPGDQRPGEPDPANKGFAYPREWCIDSILYAPYTPEEKDFYTTDYFTHYALDYIHEAHTSKQPFFLYLAYTAPHDPLMAWPEDIQKYEGRFDEGYEAIRHKRYKKQLRMGLIDSTYKLSEPSYHGWKNLSESEKEFEADKMEVYAAMIDRMDQNIGRLLKKLRDLSMMQNTIIFFASDNGASAETVELKDDNDNAPVGSMDRWVSLGENWANVSNTPFRYYKNYSYEGGINTPLIVHWPGQVEKNSFSDFEGHFIDFMATFIDIADAKYPKEFNGEKITPLKGISFLPELKGQHVERTVPLYFEWNDGRAMLYNQYKIVKEGLNNDWELYHIKTDPTETNDLSGEYPGKVAELDSLYDKWISAYQE